MTRLHRLGIIATIASLLIINATAQNVGIGTSVPDAKLHVIGNIKSTTSGYGLVQSSGSVTMGTFVDATTGGLGTLTNHPLRFFTHNNAFPSMIIENGTGHVGIGTTDPDQQLSVVGIIKSTGQIQSFNTDYGLVHSRYGLTAGTYIDDFSAYFGTQTNHPLRFFTNSNTETPAMTIQNGTGSVGIGTTNPGSRLDVVGGTIRCKNLSTGFVHEYGTTSMSTFVDGSAGWFGTISEHPLWFFTGNGGPRLAINYGNGYVGIGTTDPQQPLHVFGNFLGEGEVKSTGNGYGLLHSFEGVTVGTHVNPSAGKLGTYSNHPLWFFTNNDVTPKMAIDNTTGFVGIGTSSPTDKLHVIGHVKATGWFESLNSPVGLRQINAGITLSTYVGGGAAWFGTESNHPLWFYTNNSPTPLMVIQNTTGLVGIRKTVPEADLHIKQSASSTTRGIILEYADNANDWRAQIDNDNDFSLWYNGILKTWFWDTDGSFHMASDRRLKKDIVLMESTLSKVMELEPATYHYLDAADADVPLSSGFMAQDVQALFPDLVSEKNGYLGLNYVGFIPVAIKAIQEQQTIINVQEKRIAKLEAMVGELMTMREQPVQQGQ